MYMWFLRWLIFMPSGSLHHYWRTPFNNVLASWMNEIVVKFISCLHNAVLMHAPFPSFSIFHVQSQNSSKYVAPCASCGEYTTIGRHGNFWIVLHNHQTKSNVVPSIYCYPPSVCRTIESCVVQNPSHDTYNHLCKSDTPSI